MTEQRWVKVRAVIGNDDKRPLHGDMLQAMCGSTEEASEERKYKQVADQSVGQARFGSSQGPWIGWLAH